MAATNTPAEQNLRTQMSQNVRAASHAGSWYSEKASALESLFQKTLKQTEKRAEGETRALICPHAGYAYCATTAAWAWKQLDPAQIKRVFVLGPSHHAYVRKCALPEPRLFAYRTPLGDIPLDRETLDFLREKEMFEVLTLKEDEAEHSVEMQLPFLHHIMQRKTYSLVPIVVGDVQAHDCSLLATLLLPYFLDPECFFVFSSDFCHWGERFRYTYLPKATPSTPIYERIKMLDKEGVTCIEQQDRTGFQKYLERTGNTICGHNPILILLCLLEASASTKHDHQTSLLHYSQSSAVMNYSSSSVSYASFAVSRLPAVAAAKHSSH